MENRYSRHVSVGALLLAACALLAAVVGTVSVLASDLDFRIVRPGTANAVQFQGRSFAGNEALAPQQLPAARIAPQDAVSEH